MTALDLIKCLKCAYISELPPNISTMANLRFACLWEQQFSGTKADAPKFKDTIFAQVKIHSKFEKVDA